MVNNHVIPKEIRGFDVTRVERGDWIPEIGCKNWYGTIFSYQHILRMEY